MMKDKKEIIQHHEEIELEAMYKDIETRSEGLDCQDFNDFMLREGEKHSFIGRDDSNDRIRKAMQEIIGNEACRELLKNATAVMITAFHSPGSERPLHVDEIGCMHDFVQGLPSDCDAVWRLETDASLGNAIKIIMLINSRTLPKG